MTAEWLLEPSSPAYSRRLFAFMNNYPTGPSSPLRVPSLSRDFDFGLPGLHSGLALSEVWRNTVPKPGTKTLLFVPGAYSAILADW